MGGGGAVEWLHPVLIAYQGEMSLCRWGDGQGMAGGQREAQEAKIQGIQNLRLGLSRGSGCPSCLWSTHLFDRNEQELERRVHSKAITSQT